MGKEKKYIVSFSGGKDSTAMLLMLVKKNYPIDDIVFADTRNEFPELIEHIRKVEQRINRKITFVRSEIPYAKLLEKYGWANFGYRWCTGHLKITPINKYYKKYKDYEIINYIGFAYDERQRVKKNPRHKEIYPLIDWKITEQDALEYCYKEGFDFVGLYEHFRRLGCVACPMKGAYQDRKTFLYYPESWERIRTLNKHAMKNKNQSYKPNVSFEELDRRFKEEKKQLTLF